MLITKKTWPAENLCMLAMHESDSILSKIFDMYCVNLILSRKRQHENIYVELTLASGKFKILTLLIAFELNSINAISKK